MQTLKSMPRAVGAVGIAILTFFGGCERGADSKKDTPAVSPSGSAGGEVSGSAAKPDETTSTATAPPTDTAPAEPAKKKEPDLVTVQHILIGFKGSVPGKNITRTREEAKTLAEDLLKRAKAGEDFDALVRQYTDDRPPGIYKMANHGVPAPRGTYSRGGMVAAFGDVGFPLEVGGIGLAAYDSRKSPYGWHIIKRTE